MSNRKHSMWQSLYLNEDFSDVTVRVISRKDGCMWNYPAHSLILCAASTVIKAKLDAETDDNGKKRLTLCDLDPDSILLILRYLYFGELPTILSEITLLHLLGAANQLEIKELRDECKSRILKCIRVHNACHLLEIVSSQTCLGYGDPEVTAACYNTILNYAHIIFCSDLILCLSRENLSTILKSDKLNVLNEITAFKGLWKWGKISCCRAGAELSTEYISEYLGDLLKHVRYAHITCIDMVPKLVQDRCLLRQEGNFCVTDSEQTKIKARCHFRQPADILLHSTRVNLNDFTNNFSSSTVCHHEHILCAQFSFDANVYLSAVSIEAKYDGAELAIGDSLALSVFEENTEEEMTRENIHWEESYQSPTANEDSKDHMFMATVRLSTPVCIKRGHVFSLYLMRQSSTSDGNIPHKWTFKKTHVNRRSVSASLLLNATLHSNNFTSVTEIYVIPILNTTG